MIMVRELNSHFLSSHASVPVYFLWPDFIMHTLHFVTCMNCWSDPLPGGIDGLASNL